MTIGSNITHQVGESDAERLVAMAKRLREVEAERDGERARAETLAEALREISDEYGTIHSSPSYRDPNVLSHSPIARGIRSETILRLRAALATTPAELLARREREQAVIHVAAEYRQVNQALDEEPSPRPDPPGPSARKGEEGVQGTMNIVTLPATADSPQIEIERADGFHVSALRVNGIPVALTRYATDALFTATDNIDDAERRVAYWQASIRQTVERLMAGEMEDGES